MTVVAIGLLQWLFHTLDRLGDAEQHLLSYKWEEGMLAAEADFRAGRTRIYKLDILPSPQIGQPILRLTNEFSGRKEGTYEVWLWRRYQNDDFDILLRKEFLSSYNARMTNLLKHSLRH